MTEESAQQGLGNDPAHPAVGGVPAWLSTARHRIPQGEFLVLTLRVPNTTVTAMLSKQDAQAWIAQIQSEVDQMSSLVLAPANTPMPPLNGGHGPR